MFFHFDCGMQEGNLRIRFDNLYLFTQFQNEQIYVDRHSKSNDNHMYTIPSIDLYSIAQS